MFANKEDYGYGDGEADDVAHEDEDDSAGSVMSQTMSPDQEEEFRNEERMDVFVKSEVSATAPSGLGMAPKISEEPAKLSKMILSALEKEPEATKTQLGQCSCRKLAKYLLYHNVEQAFFYHNTKRRSYSAIPRAQKLPWELLEIYCMQSF